MEKYIHDMIKESVTTTGATQVGEQNEWTKVLENNLMNYIQY